MVPPEAFEHYYGDVVRRLFLLSGVIMLAILPIYNNFLPLSLFSFIFAILVIGLIAGLTNPMQRSVMVFNIFVSAGALAVFEYHAISQFDVIPNIVFFTEQVLAIIFFFALYLSAKTLRGSIVSDFMIKERRKAAEQSKRTPPSKSPI